MTEPLPPLNEPLTWACAALGTLALPMGVSRLGRQRVSSAPPQLRPSLAGLIKLVSKHRAQVIYTRNTKGGDAPAAGEDA